MAGREGRGRGGDREGGQGRARAPRHLLLLLPASPRARGQWKAPGGPGEAPRMPGTGEGRPPGEAARGSVPARGCCGERGPRRRGAGARGAACARGSPGKASCGWWKKRGEVLGVCLSAAQLSRLYSALVRLHRSVCVVAASRGHHSPRVQRCQGDDSHCKRVNEG